MSDDETGPAGLLDALDVQRNAVVGFVVGTLATVAVFVFFVVLPGATVRSPLYYLALAFVLAVALGGLVTVLLLVREARRLSKEL